MEFDDGEEIDVKRSKTGTIIGAALGGCCLVVCGGLLTAGVIWTFYDALFSSDYATAGSFDGPTLTLSVTVTAETTDVRETSDTSSTVLKTLARGETAEWLGWDDTLGFYLVQAEDGTVGYIQAGDATLDL